MPYKKSLLFACFLGVSLSISYCIRQDGQQEALDIARDWCQLAAYPIFLQKPEIDTTGGMFTRTFEIHFQADPKLIAEWVKQSPGLKSKPEQKPTGQHYRVNSSKAAHCDVRIQAAQVYIKTYWS